MERIKLLDAVVEDLDGSILAKQKTVSINLKKIYKIIEKIVYTFESGNKLLICGNGGSAADAQHMAAEFVNRFEIDRKPLPAIALTTDTSILTSVGNDFSFDDIFTKQIQAIGNEGDVLIAITTSGNSPNIINAVKCAKDKGMYAFVLTGHSGGKIACCCDSYIAVPSKVTAHIQETHLWIEHNICRFVDKEMFSDTDEN